MVTPCSIFAWEIPWSEEPGGLPSTGLQESDTTVQLNNSKRGITVPRDAVAKLTEHSFRSCSDNTILFPSCYPSLV